MPTRRRPPPLAHPPASRRSPKLGHSIALVASMCFCLVRGALISSNDATPAEESSPSLQVSATPPSNLNASISAPEASHNDGDSLETSASILKLTQPNGGLWPSSGGAKVQANQKPASHQLQRPGKAANLTEQQQQQQQARGKKFAPSVPDSSSQTGKQAPQSTSTTNANKLMQFMSQQRPRKLLFGSLLPANGFATKLLQAAQQQSPPSTSERQYAASSAAPKLNRTRGKAAGPSANELLQAEDLWNVSSDFELLPPPGAFLASQHIFEPLMQPTGQLLGRPPPTFQPGPLGATDTHQVALFPQAHLGPLGPQQRPSGPEQQQQQQLLPGLDSGPPQAGDYSRITLNKVVGGQPNGQVPVFLASSSPSAASARESANRTSLQASSILQAAAQLAQQQQQQKQQQQQQQQQQLSPSNAAAAAVSALGSAAAAALLSERAKTLLQNLGQPASQQQQQQTTASPSSQQSSAPAASHQQRSVSANHARTNRDAPASGLLNANLAVMLKSAAEAWAAQNGAALGAVAAGPASGIGDEVDSEEAFAAGVEQGAASDFSELLELQQQQRPLLEHHQLHGATSKGRLFGVSPTPLHALGKLQRPGFGAAPAGHLSGQLADFSGGHELSLAAFGAGLAPGQPVQLGGELHANSMEPRDYSVQHSPAETEPTAGTSHYNRLQAEQALARRPTGGRPRLAATEHYPDSIGAIKQQQQQQWRQLGRQGPRLGAKWAASGGKETSAQDRIVEQLVRELSSLRAKSSPRRPKKATGGRGGEQTLEAAEEATGQQQQQQQADDAQLEGAGLRNYNGEQGDANYDDDDDEGHQEGGEPSKQDEEPNEEAHTGGLQAEREADEQRMQLLRKKLLARLRPKHRGATNQDAPSSSGSNSKDSSFGNDSIKIPLHTLLLAALDRRQSTADKRQHLGSLSSLAAPLALGATSERYARAEGEPRGDERASSMLLALSDPPPPPPLVLASGQSSLSHSGMFLVDNLANFDELNQRSRLAAPIGPNAHLAPAQSSNQSNNLDPNTLLQMANPFVLLAQHLASGLASSSALSAASTTSTTTSTTAPPKLEQNSLGGDATTTQQPTVAAAATTTSRPTLTTTPAQRVYRFRQRTNAKQRTPRPVAGGPELEQEDYSEGDGRTAERGAGDQDDLEENREDNEQRQQQLLLSSPQARQRGRRLFGARKLAGRERVRAGQDYDDEDYAGQAPGRDYEAQQEQPEAA